MMTAMSHSGGSDRLVSLDVFRGITIAGMILVNNPGSWAHVYGPLRHAKWNGCTPTDLVFPFFLFIVGVAMAFSFDKRLGRGQSRVRLFEHVVRRTIILFLLGLILAGFPRWRLIGPYILVIVGLGLLFMDEPPLGLPSALRGRFRKGIAALLLAGGVAYFALDFGHFQAEQLRVPGVLQRIAVCYLFASIIMMVYGVRGRALIALACIVVYWVVVKNVTAPADYAVAGVPPDGLLHDWIDARVIGPHVYSERPDPEGILSTLPALATTLLGVLAGTWLCGDHGKDRKAIGLFFAANVALVAGLCMDHWFGINKKVWTSSYVVYTAGLAMHFLAMCYFVIDIKKYQRWCRPFVIFGTNAIVVYFASSITAKIIGRLVTVTTGDGELTLKQWIYQNLCVSWAGELNGSLVFALGYIVFWCLLLIPLYRARIFVKI
jgi:predicted acyltransferase